MDDDVPRLRLGGMALANGLLVHGPRHWAAAVRDESGHVRVASGRKPVLGSERLRELPLTRGLVRLGEAFAVLPVVRRGLPQARFAVEERSTAVAAVASMGAAALARRRLRSALAQESIAAVAGLAPALLALRGSRAAVWHAVEHKSIAAYERGGPEGITGARDVAKEHHRCGSNLLLPLVATTAVGNAALRRTGLRPGVVGRTAVGALAAGCAVEVFAYCARRPESPVARVVHSVGHALQSGFVTREPSPGDLVVGRVAMDALLRAEGVGAQE